MGVHLSIYSSEPVWSCSKSVPTQALTGNTDLCHMTCVPVSSGFPGLRPFWNKITLPFKVVLIKLLFLLAAIPTSPGTVPNCPGDDPASGAEGRGAGGMRTQDRIRGCLSCGSR